MRPSPWTIASSRRSTRRRASFDVQGRRYLLTDTVGFIRRLPTQLVEGFRATLEETRGADLVLHVADGSAPEQRLAEQVAAVEDVLAEIGAGELPVELVMNKIDAVGPLGETAAATTATRTPSRSRRGPARGSIGSGSGSRSASPSASSLSGCSFRTARELAWQSSTRSARQSTSAPTGPTAFSSSPACHGRTWRASLRYLVADAPSSARVRG